MTHRASFSTERYMEHDTGRGHPERPERIGVFLPAGSTGPAWCASSPGWRRATTSRLVHGEGHYEQRGAHPRVARYAFDADTPVSAQLLRHRLPGGRRRAGAARRGHGRPPAQRLCARPAARPSRRARPRHGLLPLQQRRHRRRPPARPARPRAGVDRRLGRPPRQRHAAQLRARSRRALRLDAPLSLLSRHRRDRRDRRRRRRRLHGQPPVSGRLRRRRVPRGLSHRHRADRARSTRRSWC